MAQGWRESSLSKLLQHPWALWLFPPRLGLWENWTSYRRRLFRSCPVCARIVERVTYDDPKTCVGCLTVTFPLNQRHKKALRFSIITGEIECKHIFDLSSLHDGLFDAVINKMPEYLRGPASELSFNIENQEFNAKMQIDGLYCLDFNDW
jgi:hypothetical protein